VKRRHSFVLGLALALVAAVPAAAAEIHVQGLGESWTPAKITATAGDTVVWSFPNPAEVHNVQADVQPGTANWTFETQASMPAQTASFKFEAEGIYQFKCMVHPAMIGDVTVGNPPPPPPPPLSEQPFPNDTPSPIALESVGLDTTRPTLRSVRVQRMKRGAKISFRVSEQSVVTVRFKRGGKVVKTATLDAYKSYRGKFRKGLRAGRYRVELRAEDVAGNRSALRTARVTLRRR
jgi:plastocyanin